MALGKGNASASDLAECLPLTRRAIAKHLTVLQQVGLVESTRVGRELRSRVLGARLSDTARRLERIGSEWDHRLPRSSRSPRRSDGLFEGVSGPVRRKHPARRYIVRYRRARMTSAPRRAL